MPRRVVVKECACGCGLMTKGGYFLPGHELLLRNALIRECGSIHKLRDIVEQHLKRKIVVNKFKDC